MKIKNKLRNKLLRKIQGLPAKKLSEINDFLNKNEKHSHIRKKILDMAGSWKDLEETFFNELTEKLHGNRANDRNIDIA